MSRRLVELCLLAYPRARRDRDGEFLRDLALELADTDGLARQAWSLLMGGVKDRVAAHRGSLGGRWRARSRRAAVAAVAVLTVGAYALIATDWGGERVQEAERYVCTPNDASGCAQTRMLVVAKQRAGWDCTMRRGADSTTWECTRRSRELL
jgi:hypothetical protein